MRRSKWVLRRTNPRVRCELKALIVRSALFYWQATRPQARSPGATAAFRITLYEQRVRCELKASIVRSALFHWQLARSGIETMGVRPPS